MKHFFSKRSVNVYTYSVKKPGSITTNNIARQSKLELTTGNIKPQTVTATTATTSSSSTTQSPSSTSLTSSTSVPLRTTTTTTSSSSPSHATNVSLKSVMPPPPPSPKRHNPPSPSTSGSSTSSIGGKSGGNVLNYSISSSSSSTNSGLSGSVGGPLGAGGGGTTGFIKKSIRMYHDETLTSFFRRLAFTPDGALLITPAGIIKGDNGSNYYNTSTKDKDNKLSEKIIEASSSSSSMNSSMEKPSQMDVNKKGKDKESDELKNTVFVYTRNSLHKQVFFFFFLFIELN